MAISPTGFRKSMIFPVFHSRLLKSNFWKIIARPISDFWNPLPRPWKRFWMGMFKFSEWDLEQTTTKSTIIIYTSLDSSFAAIEQTPHRIVLFWYTLQCHNNFFQPSWLEVCTLLAVSIQFTKPVIGLSKYVKGVAIKNAGHPGRRFLMALPLVFPASPLCVFTLRLLKPPSYVG